MKWSVLLLILGGCTTLAPSAAVMPGPGKTLATFNADQTSCTEYADSQLADAAHRYNTNQVATVAVGTVLGAGLGAAIGGGHGAGIGAASGAIAGVAVDGTSSELDRLQRRYDIAFSQCMLLRGNNVPQIY